MNAMLFLCILSVAISTWAFPQTVTKSEDDGRIYFGTIYDKEKYPYLVHIRIPAKGGVSVCTGTMIAPLFVLTASHCMSGKEKLGIKIHLGGVLTGIHEEVEEIYVHPLYDDKSYIADISLIKIKAPFPSLQRFVVASGNPDDFVNGKEVKCVAMGFGLTNGEKSSQEGLMINVVARYGIPPCLTGMKAVAKEFLCGKPDNHTVCSGDSGGPLICGDQQYGVISHTVNLLDGEVPCGSDKVEDKYLFVYNYKDWISSHVDPPKEEEKSYCPIIKPYKIGTMFVAFMLLGRN